MRTNAGRKVYPDRTYAIICGVSDDDLRKARDDTRRYWLHNLYLGPDFGRVVTEYLGAPRTVRWLITLAIVALIMTGPVIGIAIALLD